MTAARSLDTQQAFDGVAAGYDRSNAANPILCAMRARVLRTLSACRAARLARPRSRLRARAPMRALARRAATA